MSEWREVKTLYGIRERWTPTFAGDWPVDEPVPAPCAACGGKLERWPVVLNAEAISLAQLANARAKRNSKFLPVEVPEPVYTMHYEFSHYRDCIPVASVDEVELRPPRRV
jgi:hypothetical protein